MEKVKETLDRLYQACINTQTHWRFFLGLFDYVEYISDIPDLKNISGEIFKKSQKDFLNLQKLGRVCLSELKTSIHKIFLIISKNKIKSPYLTKQTTELESALEEEAFFKDKHPVWAIQKIDSVLERIATELCTIGYKKLVIKEFMDKACSHIDNTDSQKNIIKFIFSKSLNKYIKEGSLFFGEYRFDIRNDYENIIIVYDYMVYGQMQETELKQKASRDKSESMAYQVMIMSKINTEFDFIESNADITDDQLKFFKRSELQDSFDRIHSYFVKELSNIKEKNPKEMKSKEKVIIDFQKGIYNATSTKKIYEISGKRLKIVEYLCGNNTASLMDLSTCTEQENSLIVQEIGKINSTFRKKLNIKIDLIIHSRTGGGYRLNRDQLDLSVKTLT